MHVAVCCTRCIYHCKEYVIFLPHSRHLFTLSSAITRTDDISKTPRRVRRKTQRIFQAEHDKHKRCKTTTHTENVLFNPNYEK